MSDNPIKFPSSLSSSEDELPSHHSEENISSDDGMSDYSPPWSFEKEDLEEEDEEDKDDANAEDDDDDSDNHSNDFDSDSDFASPPPKRVRRASYI
jgi:hypothetical protein